MDHTAAPHGTASRYNNQKCRCTFCRRAWADYIADRRRAQGVPSRALAREDWQQGDAYFPDKSERLPARRCSALGLRLLEAAEARTGRNADDVIEALLRSCAQRVEFQSTGD